jgi:hypothetical protein
MAQNRVGSSDHSNELSGFIKGSKFFDQPNNYSLFKKKPMELLWHR